MILPHQKSIRNWTSSVDGEPGFLKEVLDSLGTLDHIDKHCNLTFDAMSIKKQVLWSVKEGKFIGFCDLGNELDLEGTETVATEVLVFMLVSLNGKWKLPIGYFFLNKITAVTQAELIKTALTLTDNVGLTVWGITCDGAYSNLATMKILGCEFENQKYDDIKCWFNHPVNNSKVYFIPDACHNLKLARNTLGNCKTLESDNGYIRWEHIYKLQEVQNELTFKFRNKLSASHINWQNNKMKVKFAAQTLSSSTADALEFLKKINFPNFYNVDATVQYCRAIDKIFDFLNSKSCFSKGFKSPISKNNIDVLKSIILPLVDYLYTLKYNDNLLHKSNKKTFIIGFTIAVKSLFSIAETIFSRQFTSMNFSYILTYKFSQDHLELLFGQIRQRLGSNNNPNVVQFKTAIKQILLKNFIKCKSNGNCNTFDDDITGGILDFKWSKKVVDVYEDNFSQNQDDEELINRMSLLNNVSTDMKEAKENIIYYILGYIIKQIIKILDCESCKQCLFKDVTDHDYCNVQLYTQFTEFKNNGGLISGSESAYKIIREAENYLIIFTSNLKTLNVQNLETKILYNCINKFSLNTSIFPSLNCPNITILEKPHKITLITILVKKFLSIRLKSYGKMFSCNYLNPDSKRHKLNKIVLFSHQ